MKDKIIGLTKILMFGIIVGVLGTFLVYRQFPQYLCYAIYDVTQSNLYQKANVEMAPGTTLVEHFVPRNDYLTGIRIHVERDGIEDYENVVVGRLLNSEQKVLAEASFNPQEEFFEFEFNKWVDTDKEYQLEIVFPEGNATPIVTTFGPADIGPDEHRALYIDGECSEEAIYAEYVYGTYSKKLLAFWMLVFFVGGMMMGDAIFFKKNNKN